jgi:predicted acylesterase/phospholipase RssA
MTIKHLVFSGGGPSGLVLYGAAKRLNNVCWHIRNIKSIYGTSIGAFISVIISLDYKWDVTDDYFIKRPWKNILNIEPLTIINAYNTKGLINESFICEALLPLLEAKGLNKNTTFQELYDFNKIDIHMYATNLNGDRMSIVDISHRTFPELTIIKGVSMSTAYPFIFCPVIENGNCYVDGGIMNNFPLLDCYNNNKCADTEILGFNACSKNINLLSNLETESTLFDYFIILFKKIKREIETDEMDISNIVKCEVDTMGGFQPWIDAIESSESRENSIKLGIAKADIYIENMTDNGQIIRANMSNIDISNNTIFKNNTDTDISKN